MTPNVIFILLNNPWDVLVAIKTGEEGYRNYDLQDLEWGWDYHSKLEENPLLEELDVIPDGITQIYEWPNYKERFEKALIYKI